MQNVLTYRKEYFVFIVIVLVLK